MSATKRLQKALKTMTTEQMVNLLEARRKELDVQKNPMIRSSLKAQIGMLEQALKPLPSCGSPDCPGCVNCGRGQSNR